MPIVVACPGCQKQLRVADELAEQMVRCPSCSMTFLPSTGSTPPPVSEPPTRPWEDVPLERIPASPLPDLSLDEPEDPVPPPSSTPRARLPDDDEDMIPCPDCGRSMHRDAPRCPRCGRRSDRTMRSLVRRPRRRDSEPDRGALVLTLGIISIVALSLCAPVSMIPGLIAWVLGSSDLRKMREGSMDASNKGLTHAGWICGIIGTLAGFLLTLVCGGFFALAIYSSPNPQPQPRFNQPPTRPMPPPPRRVPRPANKPNDWDLHP